MPPLFQYIPTPWLQHTERDGDSVFELLCQILMPAHRYIPQEPELPQVAAPGEPVKKQRLCQYVGTPVQEFHLYKNHIITEEEVLLLDPGIDIWRLE